MRTSRAIGLLLLLSCLLFASSASAYSFAVALNGMASKWEPGPGVTTFFGPATPPGTPGSATWSLMPAGVYISLGDLSPYHLNGFLSSSMTGMTGLPDVGGVPYEVWAINNALDQWASASGFTNLGQVADGSPNGAPNCNGLYNGCVDVGDIRIGAYPFSIVNGYVILAHSFQPGTSALDPPYGSIGGDAHFNNDLNGSFPNQVTWVDDPLDLAGNGTYDFYTVVLHEMGHSLGLDHSSDPSSVMALYSAHGALRTLTADDIAGIQAIYGPRQAPVVPEPGTLTLLGLGLAGRALVAWRRKK